MSAPDPYLSPFEHILLEYGPDPRFGIERYRSIRAESGADAALRAAAAHYRTRLCQVRELRLPSGRTRDHIDDGITPVDKSDDPIGEVVGEPRYVGSRRQCAAILHGKTPEPTWLERIGL